MADLRRLVGTVATLGLMLMAGCGGHGRDVGAEPASGAGCAALFTALRDASVDGIAGVDDARVAAIADLLEMDPAAVGAALVANDPLVMSEIRELCTEASELAEQNQSGEPTVVYVAARSVPAGTDALVAELSGAIEARELPSEMVSDNAVSDPAVLVGQRFKTDVPVGRVVSLSDLSR